jgi:cyanophycin synthetase
MHLKPESGQPRPVGRAIVDELFPNGDDGRIPVVGVTGSFGKTTVARLIARLLCLSGKHTGLACSSGLFVDRRCIDQGMRELGIRAPHPDESLRRSSRLRKRQRQHPQRRSRL